MKGQYLWRLARYEEAIESFNESISIKPNSSAYNWKGI